MRYLLICPYFGKLPNNFQTWLDTCKRNGFVDFLIFTDDRTKYQIPDNVDVRYMSFQDLQSLIQSKFEFPVKLKNPYKLCDFKPAYGFVFNDYIIGYDYWGNCDLDLIYGDLGSFLPKRQYDKISNLGHTTFYRNTDNIVQAFKERSRSPLSYREIFSTDANLGFDEIGEYGIRHIFEEHGYTVYPFERYAGDMTTNTSNLRLSHYHVENNSFIVDKNESIFTYEDGHLYGWTLNAGILKKREYAYLHFQKRKITDHRTSAASSYIIGPHGFYDYEEVTPSLIRKYHGHDKDIEWFRRKYKALKNKIYRNKSIRELEGKKS